MTYGDDALYKILRDGVNFDHYRLYKTELSINSKENIDQYMLFLHSNNGIMHNNLLSILDFIIDLKYKFTKTDITIICNLTNGNFKKIFDMLKHHINMDEMQPVIVSILTHYCDFSDLRYCCRNGFKLTKNVFNEAIYDAIKTNDINYLAILCENDCPSYAINDVEYDIDLGLSPKIVKILVDNGRTLPYSMCNDAIKHNNMELFRYCYNLGCKCDVDDIMDVGGLFL